MFHPWQNMHRYAAEIVPRVLSDPRLLIRSITICAERLSA
jgi:hypothetical protein